MKSKIALTRKLSGRISPPTNRTRSKSVVTLDEGGVTCRPDAALPPAAPCHSALLIRRSPLSSRVEREGSTGRGNGTVRCAAERGPSTSGRHANSCELAGGGGRC